MVGLTVIQFQGFIFVACRLAGLFLDAPILSNQNIPAMVKVAFLVFLSIIVFPLVSIEHLMPINNNLALIITMIKEIAIGLVVGFVARIFFSAVQISGQLIDYQMGFGFVNIVDPESRVQVPIIGQFMFILTTFIFLLINGHHYLIQSRVKSFQTIPLGGFTYNANLTTRLVTVFSDIFVIGFKIASPLVMTLFLVDLAYGVIARAVPQANILVVGFPLKIGLGLFFLFVFIQLFFIVMKQLFVDVLPAVNGLFRLM
jgi:flagellar biosynthetic protein FliR